MSNSDYNTHTRDDYVDANSRFLPSWLTNIVLPVGVFIIVVAIMCALVLSGVVQGNKTRSAPQSTTTVPTIELLP